MRVVTDYVTLMLTFKDLGQLVSRPSDRLNRLRTHTGQLVSYAYTATTNMILILSSVCVVSIFWTESSPSLDNCCGEYNWNNIHHYASMITNTQTDTAQLIINNQKGHFSQPNLSLSLSLIIPIFSYFQLLLFARYVCWCAMCLSRRVDHRIAR